METFSTLLALCEGSHQSPVVSLRKSQWRGALMLYLMNKCLSKQSRRRWFETPSRSLCCYFSRYIQPQRQMGHNLYIASKFDVSHYSDVLMRAMAHQITCVSIVCSTVCSGADKKKSNHRVIGLCEENHWSPVDSPHKGPVTRKMFLFGDIIM